MIIKLFHFLIFTFVLVNGTVAQIEGRKSPPLPLRQTNRPSISNERWYTLTAPDKDFIVQFPAKPKRQADSEAPSGTLRGYILDTNSMSLGLSYIDVGVDPNSLEGNRLPLTFRQAMLDHAKERGWLVIHSKLLRKNVYEQESWSPMKANPNLRLHYVERTIIRYGRQYILHCYSIIPEQKVNSVLCYRFLDSFRAVREPQPQ